MTWIKTVPPREATGELRECYAALSSLYPTEYMSEVPAIPRHDGNADSITAVHSLIPQAMRHALSTYGVLLSAELPLTRRQHEMIATVVSVTNQCFY